MTKAYRYFVSYARRYAHFPQVITRTVVKVHKPITSQEDLETIEKSIHAMECKLFVAQMRVTGFGDLSGSDKPEDNQDLVVQIINFQLLQEIEE